MSNIEDMDDDGWGDAAQLVNEDDDWGAMENDDNDAIAGIDGNMDADDWGGISEAGEHGNGSDLPIEVQIANLFYEAEDAAREYPQTRALDMFLQVQSLTERHFAMNGDRKQLDMRALPLDVRTIYFQAGLQRTKMLLATRKKDEMINEYTNLLRLVPKVTRNEAQAAIDAVLNQAQTAAAASGADDEHIEIVLQLYQLTEQVLSSISDTERLLFSVKMRLCRLYVDRHEYERASSVLDELHRACQNPDATDDQSKGSELLEIYALQIRMSTQQQDLQRMRSLYAATKGLSAAVKDPRSQSVIRECWGLMFGYDQQWQRAYTEFYSAFQAYQEIGAKDAAKKCLQYVVVANLLSGGEQNPFDAREAKVYQSDPSIQIISSLRTAFENVDVPAFAKARSAIADIGDKFILSHLANMVRDFHLKAIQRIIQPYKRVSLSHLGDALQVETKQVEQLLVQLILDGELDGRIDQINGILELSQGGKNHQKFYTALEQWSNVISTVSRGLTRQPMISE